MVVQGRRVTAPVQFRSGNLQKGYESRPGRLAALGTMAVYEVDRIGKGPRAKNIIDLATRTGPPKDDWDGHDGHY